METKIDDNTLRITRTRDETREEIERVIARAERVIVKGRAKLAILDK